METKQNFSRSLAHADRDAVLQMADQVRQMHPVRLIRAPAKTLVMLRARESVRGELFNFGELLATECLVEVAGVTGVAVLAGSDPEKCLAMAILDAAHSAKLDIMQQFAEQITKFTQARLSDLQHEAAQHQKTRVQFKIMEDLYVATDGEH